MCRARLLVPNAMWPNACDADQSQRDRRGGCKEPGEAGWEQQREAQDAERSHPICGKAAVDHLAGDPAAGQRADIRRRVGDPEVEQDVPVIPPADFPEVLPQPEEQDVPRCVRQSAHHDQPHRERLPEDHSPGSSAPRAPRAPVDLPRGRPAPDPLAGDGPAAGGRPDTRPVARGSPPRH